MSKGYILVRLFEVNNILPKTEANLKITNAKNGNVVYEKYNAFDISGRSELIPVETIDKSLSQEPNREGIVPYMTYDIEVTSDGYKPFLVKGINVFEEITSIQTINMIEESNNIIAENNLEESNNIRFKNILKENNNMRFNKAIEEARKQEPLKAKIINKQRSLPVYASAFKSVFIPEFIVVHLGSPTSSAENVTVRFIDYIKNVASSEIYPTWPEEAIKANVYCQISFALNRVYTEWYRSKGYPFQITNSTAYDQYFVKGRSIFDNISKIVDKIFNEYIRTIGNITPLFAQYCNGTTVRCSGVSQWGTVDLAKRGMKALEIIKYYFGEDKELVKAVEIEGIPESYQGIPLKINDANENVKTIQKQLNRISKNFPAIPKIYPEDGVFGKGMEEAVKVFQKVFNLTVDGIIGKATWYSISNIYVGVKRLAELNQESEIELETGGNKELEESKWDGKYPGYLLKYGSRGDKVKELQYYLVKISKQYNIPSVSMDSIFGNNTKKSIMAFQRLFGLSEDGIVGQATWNKILEIIRTK